MFKKDIWKRPLLFFSICAMIFSGTPIYATETTTDTAVTESSSESTEGENTEEETTQKNRLEPDAYFEPIQTNEITSWPQGPAVWAEAAVVMDLDSGTFLYSKNMDAAKYPASITKIMTALVAIENSSLLERVTFSENAIWGIERDSSHIGIRIGEILSMEECLYGMMLESANEVCLAVAEHISGSVEGFVELMNQKAAELGCTNTHFTNPNGLPDENHYTTAHDMALIAQAAYANPTFRKIVGTNSSTIPTTNKCGEIRWLSNHHKMLSGKAYAYEGCTGGKTGYTQAALNTLVTYAERNGRRLVCVSLRTNGAQIYIDTASMLDYGFNNFQNICIYDRSSCPGSQMLYPSLYFGQPTTIDALKNSCTLTIPVTASQEEITQTTALTDTSILTTYQYQQYTVGENAISTTAIQALLTQAPAVTTKESTLSALLSSLTPSDSSQNTEKGSSVLETLASIPIYIYLLVILLILVLILEIVLAYKKAKRRKARRRRKRGKKNIKKGAKKAARK